LLLQTAGLTQPKQQQQQFKSVFHRLPDFFSSVDKSQLKTIGKLV